jgi:hypothetical protein
VKKLTKKEEKRLFTYLMKKNVSSFNSSEKGVLNLTLRISKINTLKERLRRWLQTYIKVRTEVTMLNSGIITLQKRFKNKTVIEVSNPQTDYNFYKKCRL